MSNQHSNTIMIVVLLIWAGACIGANMIAAPAKFQVVDLTRPVALQVGRMQFQWVGYFEYILAALAVLSALTATHHAKIFVALAVLLLVVQRFVILPQLSVQTDQVIGGISAGGSSLHTYFIVLEIAKATAIIGGALTALRALSIRSESI